MRDYDGGYQEREIAKIKRGCQQDEKYHPTNPAANNVHQQGGIEGANAKQRPMNHLTGTTGTPTTTSTDTKLGAGETQWASTRQWENLME